MAEWRDISAEPDRPMDVLFFLASAVWTVHDTGEPADVPVGCRYEVGYWDGESWLYHGSNHEVFELGLKPGDLDAPTHWMPLPDPPHVGRVEGEGR